LALGVNPNLAEARALDGRLRLGETRLETDPVRRATAAKAAAESLRKALAINRFLEREFRPFLAEAERLARAAEPTTER
jgi:hypothetical protein